jgi:hypothetical protein
MLTCFQILHMSKVISESGLRTFERGDRKLQARDVIDLNLQRSNLLFELLGFLELLYKRGLMGVFSLWKANVLIECMLEEM